ncbi:hypothetical protein KFK09_009230 [Dendrobium nobile]|uniref:Uncharacterized protein n=1 Tax=Dendrobium nobile TaxID=94219 RepID=A0A8T3BSZ1_DENNO|nr:hypothetical protein KFK09_009230 [Dendrobium nobile]
MGKSSCGTERETRPRAYLLPLASRSLFLFRIPTPELGDSPSLGLSLSVRERPGGTPFTSSTAAAKKFEQEEEASEFSRLIRVGGFGVGS